ncbi:hypothetical protein B0H16DRAFT_1730653 [Mycena metata]|uniref:Uncharacterized protein n=1 Tax=Mycena metata TaxID=1033252 RepID=A0AAD7I7N5_9AGAR|nr:hypothetical protein B0H16DRAFT_1730653 [Mycena metata]
MDVSRNVITRPRRRLHSLPANVTPPPAVHRPRACQLSAPTHPQPPLRTRSATSSPLRRLKHMPVRNSRAQAIPPTPPHASILKTSHAPLLAVSRPASPARRIKPAPPTACPDEPARTRMHPRPAYTSHRPDAPQV